MDIGTIFSMDCEASSPCNEADNLVARYGVTAFSKLNNQTINTLDLDSVILASFYGTDDMS